MTYDEIQNLSKKLTCADVVILLSQYEYVVTSSAEGTRYITIPESRIKTTEQSPVA